jgi:type VII secretion protein EccB
VLPFVALPEDLMASRLDEVHAHQYTTQRVVNALTRHDADPLARPPRTLTLVLVGGMVAGLLAAGALVFNVFTGQGGPRDLRDSSTVLVEKESGAQFVYTKSDSQLHPVLNYASGLLIAEGSGAEPTVVRRKRLASLRSDKGIQVGATLGIAGAPNALPRRSDLIRDAWQVCTRSAAGDAPRTDLFVGANVAGGQVLAAPRTGSAGESLLVQTPDESVFLVFANKKFSVPRPAVLLAAFGWTGRQPQPVSAGWINALPAGPDIDTLPIAGLGQRSRVINDTIGRLYQAPGTGVNQWAVVQRDRVQPVSDVQARLLQADPRINVGDPVKVSTAFFATLPSIGAPSADPAQDGVPTIVPALLPMGSSACARVPDAAAGVTSVVLDAALPAAAPVPAGAAPASSADFVSVPFGRGVLVRAAASATAPASSGTVSILTDSGLRYPIADNNAMTRLGFGGSNPVAMPSELVSLLPVGPTLSTSAALRAS